MSMMNTNTAGINSSCLLSKALIHSITLGLNENKFGCLSKRNKTLDSYVTTENNKLFLLLYYQEASYTLIGMLFRY